MRRLRGWFYWIFLITAGSLFVTYHRHLATHPMAREDEAHLERPYPKDSLDQVAEWRIVLEGMDGQAPITGGFNRTAAVAGRGRDQAVQSDLREEEVSSDFPLDDRDGLHKVSFTVSCYVCFGSRP